MINSSYIYGFEEYLGLHVFLSNFFWWLSVGLVVLAYRKRHIWKVGRITWIFLFLTFLCFGIRELGHFSGSLIFGSLRYMFGIWSVIFMTSVFVYLYEILYNRKKVSRIKTSVPFAVASIFPILMFYLYFSGTNATDLKSTISTIETLAWMSGSMIIIFTTYRLGTRSTGDFVNIYMFFQFAAFSAFVWKLLGFMGIIGYPAPYYIRELIETLFGLFAIISMYLLTKMLRRLSRQLHSD